MVLWPWEGEASQVLFETAPTPRHHFAIVQLANGLRALDDLVAGRRLGSVDFVSRFRVQLGNREGILFAGADDAAVTVTVSHGNTTEQIEVLNGVWLSTPLPLVPGTFVTVEWHHADRELRFTTLGPLQPSSETSDAASGWVGYADK